MREGFHTGVRMTELDSYETKNLLSARDNPDSVCAMISEETQKGYLLGPFETPPFSPYRVSPVGIAEHKYSRKKRLIVDLSSPHENACNPSINDLISKEECKLTYVKLDDAIQIILKLGQGSWLCKVDVKDAFKQIPIHPSLWHLHGIKWNSLYYFYTRLVFGSRSSPKIFDALSQALVWIAHKVYGIEYILHLLDDFLTIAPPNAEPMRNMALLTHIFNKLNIPLSTHKSLGPAQELEYLGIILDTNKMEARLPANKLERIAEKLALFAGKRSCTKRELLSLLGHLVFASRVVIPGRTFLSRLFRAAKGVRELHHRVTLTSDCKADIRMWTYLIKFWNGVSMFLETTETSSDDLDLYTDASGTLGFGGYWQGRWFCGSWSATSLDLVDEDLSIAYQELYPIAVAVQLWGKSWSRRRIIFHCDNMATVHILNKGRSPCKSIMKLMRKLVITAIINNFSYRAVFLPGRTNSIADALSRFQLERFRQLAPQAAATPCPLPVEMTFD